MTFIVWGIRNMTMVTVEQLREQIHLVQSLTRVELRVAVVQEFIEVIHLSEQPTFIISEGNQLLEQLVSKAEERKVRVLSGAFGSYYFGIHWQGLAYLLGPFCIEQPIDDYKFSRLLNQLDLELDAQLILEAYLDQRAIFEPDVMRNWGKLLGSFLTTQQIPIQAFPSVTSMKPIQENSINAEIKKFLVDDVISTRYEIEQLWIKAISAGDETDLRRVVNQYGEQTRMPPRVKSSLQDKKFLAVTLNSIGTRAAIAGGVSPQIADSLSLRNVKLIEQCNNYDEVIKLSEDLPFQYCKMVNWYSVRKYSALIRSTITLILSNFQSSMGLIKLAEELKVSPEHLARQFKKEVGYTVSQYTHHAKIRESLPFVISEQYGIEAIAEKLGYCSAPYFRKVFKEVMKCTPLEYKRANTQ